MTAHSAARARGASFERLIADALAAHVDDVVDRRVKTGALDKGDIGGLRTPRGHRVVVECKNTKTMNLAGWVQEAQREAVNDNAIAGIVVHKRRGKGDPMEQYVTMTLRDYIVLVHGVTS